MPLPVRRTAQRRGDRAARARARRRQAARITEDSGVDALWLSGLELSTMLGLPDENVLASRDLADAVLALRRTANLPVILDIDNAGPWRSLSPAPPTPACWSRLPGWSVRATDSLDGTADIAAPAAVRILDIVDPEPDGVGDTVAAEGTRHQRDVDSLEHRAGEGAATCVRW
ncbi:isocitrate lyase/phosphoenolpyruvate mutase family protein [Streptomyces californicus]|uniref:isocitrate lyase/phosphoenolpyruvate mutase family protein n=1 Tax=Streptomyces californicus TaxID=67351 RepID=UPI003723B0D0